MAKNLGARTVMIMNQAKQEVVRREESKEVQKNDLENDIMLQTKSESETLKSVGKISETFSFTSEFEGKVSAFMKYFWNNPFPNLLSAMARGESGPNNILFESYSIYIFCTFIKSHLSETTWML